MQRHLPKAGQLVLDLSEVSLEQLHELDVRNLDGATLYLPLPSVGSTNMHSDICVDYIEASWAAEKLAATSEQAAVSDDYSIPHKTRLRLELTGISATFCDALENAIVLFRGGDEDEDKYVEILDQVREYEHNIETYAPRLPEIIDDYFANLVNGAYYEFRNEAPEHYEAEIARYPERQFGFHKTALSHRLGATSFASPDGWLVPCSVGVDTFFEVTGQKYRLNDFMAGTLFMVGGKSFVRSDDLAASFPMDQYVRSRFCGSLATLRDKEAWPWEYAAWSDAAFAPPLSSHPDLSPQVQDGQRNRQACLIHTSGTLIIADDGKFRHFLYGAAPLNPVAVRRLYDELTELSDMLAPMIGLPSSPSYDWGALTDEEFEQLCYDLISAHAKFDSETIRKLGKSRSRDGGRDLEVRELPAQRGLPARKWLFQCKLVSDGSSLSGRKIQDIGDMLDAHNAGGFGVMTSALIDATLYDKLDAVCDRRGIAQLNFSRLELEKALVQYPAVYRRYFRKT